MIDQIDVELRKWAESVVPDAEVSFDTPAAPGEESAIHFYLLEIVDAKTGQNVQRDHWQVFLRYLITAPLANVPKQRRQFGDLLFAAMECADFDVDLNPPAATVWSALGARPRAAFVLSKRLCRRRERKIAPRVTKPMTVRTSALRRLDGTLIGRENAPLIDAKVDVPSLGLATRTDAAGRFSFAAVPTHVERTALRITIEGKQITLSSEQFAGDQPVKIHLDSMEG